MKAYYEKYGFYTIDTKYVEYLHSKDTEVFYSIEHIYNRKPYLGIIANLGGFDYCIPLTSAKYKHIKWKNVSKDNYVIYENVEDSELHKGDICNKIGVIKKNGARVPIYKKILAVLDIKKMIPVDKLLYSYIDFDNESDENYRILLQKEYKFLYPHKDTIIEKAKLLYINQQESGKIENFYCSFSLLESACNEYILLRQIIK